MYALIKYYLKEKIEKLATGVCQKAIIIDNIKNLEIPIIDLEFQKEIGDIIFSIEDTIKSNEKVKSILEKQIIEKFVRMENN